MLSSGLGRKLFQTQAAIPDATLAKLMVGRRHHRGDQLRQEQVL